MNKWRKGEVHGTGHRGACHTTLPLVVFKWPSPAYWLTGSVRWCHLAWLHLRLSSSQGGRPSPPGSTAQSCQQYSCLRFWTEAIFPIRNSLYLLLPHVWPPCNVLDPWQPRTHLYIFRPLPTPPLEEQNQGRLAVLSICSPRAGLAVCLGKARKKESRETERVRNHRLY